MGKIKAFVARDKSSKLFMYLFEKPQLNVDVWLPDIHQFGYHVQLPEKMCQNVTFKNSPKEIEIELP